MHVRNLCRIPLFPIEHYKTDSFWETFSQTYILLRLLGLPLLFLPFLFPSFTDLSELCTQEIVTTPAALFD